jgi:hypothetical protein
MLGADDCLTIPINEDDLIATIFGSLKRSKTINLINEKISEIYLSNQVEKELVSETHKDLTLLIEVTWDDIIGPNLQKYFPKNLKEGFPLEKITNQLYDVISSIYGQDMITKAEGLLLNIKNFNLMSYVFFDSYPDPSYRGGHKDFMLSIIAPKITYFQSLKCKQIFIELANLYKEKKEWDIEEYWNKFIEILSITSV